MIISIASLIVVTFLGQDVITLNAHIAITQMLIFIGLYIKLIFIKGFICPILFHTYTWTAHDQRGKLNTVIAEVCGIMNDPVIRCA